MKKNLLITALLLFPLVANGWWNKEWSFRKQIKIDTTDASATIATAANDVPVLIRLHTGNFGYFMDLLDNGGDIRFMSGDDQKPLKFHVEKFDPINEMAFIWVKLPVVQPNASADTIWMYYGNNAVTNGSDAAGTYDAHQALIYHFNSTNNIPQDATAFANNPTVSEVEFTPASLIGGGAKFNGKSIISVPATPSLSISNEKGWSFSAWVKITEAQNEAYLVSVKAGTDQLILAINGADLVGRAINAKGGIETAKATLTLGSWHQVALTVGGGKLTTYVDGMVASAVDLKLADITGDVVIGAEVQGKHGLIGEMDEVAISNVARGSDWIKATVVSQVGENKLINYGADEKSEGGGDESYFKITLQNVTLDGWIVIGILCFMAAISWVVMLGKGLVINRVRRDNRAFIKDFKRLGAASPAKLDQTESDNDEEDSPLSQALFGKHDHYQSSSIYRIYHAGIQNLEHRFGKSVGSQAVKVLTPQAINTIRAGLDASLVRETQKLNSQMVLLTIAISGGPFLGLLGTVVGVMITFAAIAASGDVNVNAIAPGIAAALVATVAGLVVAIPALFAYNYLGSRIKEISADMHVFVDEFITRIAEYYAE